MPYWQLFYHLVWATKNREPLLTQQAEPVIYDFLRAKAIGLGATVFALNGVEDHVHMVASIPPAISLSRFVGQVKAAASARLNKSQMSAERFSWQNEYAVFSLDRTRLKDHIAYVERQKKHHAQGTMIPELERLRGEAARPQSDDTDRTKPDSSGAVLQPWH